MRRTFPFVIFALVLAPAALSAQETGGASQSGPPTPTATATEADQTTPNFADFIGRGTIFGDNSDKARFERYRDLRDGGTLDAFRYTSDTMSRHINVQADHVGYRDQRYSAAYDDFGKLKVTFEWNQIPLFFSQDTATLFSEVTPGVLRISDAIQSGIQNKTTTIGAAVGQAQPFDLRLQRDILSLRMTYTATPNLDWNVAIKNTTKDGTQPWAGTFGFSDAVELAVPVDTRTTDIGTSLEWRNDRASATLGYDGSFFRNNIGTLIWDNPLRITDSSTAGPLQGRMSLWPNNNLNTASASGSISLPANSRATGYLSIGAMTQNDALIPFTTNSALPTIPLDRTTADAKAIVTAQNYQFTSRPVEGWWFNVRYRSYDFDNRTPVFNVSQTVAYDTTVEAFAEGGTSPFSFTRRNLDAEASYTGFRWTALRAGYSREQVDQTFRTFDTTVENTARLSADVTGISWLTLRGVYEHAKRTGSGLDEQALDDLGEQVSLRQFDISDRTTNRFSGIVLVMPFSSLSFNGTVSAGNEDRPPTMPSGQETFGLRSNDSRSYSIGMDYVPRDQVSFGISYEFEKYTADQLSRQANPGVQFNDPTRDWTTDGADRAHTLFASLDLLKVWPKTDVRFGYDFSRAETTYIYGLAANTTLPPVVQLPPVQNELQRGTADLRYTISRHFQAGGAYWFEKYTVDNFAQNPSTLSTLAQPSFLILGYLTRPYTANTIIGRVTYLW